MELWKLISIFNDKNRFLTLSEIYEEYQNRYDISEYKHFDAAIRTAINRNCVNRDLNYKGNNIFVSFSIKGLKGQKYGLFEWIDHNICDTKINESTLIKTPRFYVCKDIGTKVCRDEKVKNDVLNRSNYLCEINAEHKTFIKRVDNKPYMEVHHLIPLEMQFLEKFKNINLDCKENAVSLCSNCHNEIHYGRNNIELIRILYNKRVQQLKEVGIDISLEELISYYK